MPPTAADRHFALYAALTATAALARSEFGLLLHVAAPLNVGPTTWPYVLAALVVLARPSDVRAFLALTAFTLVDIVAILPMSPNHWLLAGVVGAGWWATALTLWVRDRRLPTGGTLLLAGLPAFRFGVALFYLFTGLWKANSGFVDPATSCGMLSWMRLARQFPGLPTGPTVAHAVIGFTLLLEHGGPALLLWGRTRAATAVFFAFFHAVLALDLLQNYQNFSWCMLALLALFLEPVAIERARLRAPRLSDAWRWGRIGAIAVWIALIAFTALLGSAQQFTALRWAFAASTAWVWLAIFAWVALPPLPVTRPRGVAAAWLMPLLVLVNGTAPIVGWKNRNAWQMYSNLRLEAEVSNHWIFGPSLDWFGYQRDRVTVLDTGDRDLAWEAVGKGYEITFHDLRSRVQRHPEARITYVHNGQVHAYARAGDDPALTPPPWLTAKLVWFRPIGPGVERQCQW